MKFEKLANMPYYTQAEKYENGDIDFTGPNTTVNILELLKTPLGGIYCVGDSEEGFDCEYLEFLDDVVGYGEYVERKERHNEEYDTILSETLYETEYGNICVVAGESQNGTISVWFANEITKNNLEIAFNNPDEVPEYPEVTLTVSSETVKKLIEHWETDVEDVYDSLQNDINEMILKSVGIQN